MDVSQISMPMRILLIGAAVFLAAWFTVLKPGGATEELPPVTPANTAPATGATANANAAATPAPAQDTAVAATAIPAEVLAELPQDVAKAIKARKTLVLGVFTDDAEDYRPMADDDRYVRNALKKTNRYKGEVFAKNISVSDLVDYAPLVNDLGVKQSPSVVVIDRDLKGTVLTGYVDRVAINQAIADARRTSIVPAITDDYLAAANDVCGRYRLLISRLSYPTVHGTKVRDKALARAVRVGRRYEQAISKLDTPAKWEGLQAHWLRVVKDDADTAAAMSKALKAGDKDAFYSAYRSFNKGDARRLDRRFDKAGVTGCVFNRRS